MAIEAVTWIDSDGVETPWPTQLLRGMTGRGAPPSDIVVKEVPGGAGAVRVGERHLERIIELPLLLDGAPSTHRSLVRAWAARLSTVRGVGTIRFDLVDGSQRQISASCSRNIMLSDEQIATMTEAVLEFRCHDPYLSDTVGSTVSAIGETAAASWFPLFPLVLASSEIAVEVIVDNTGDVEVWPVITITGPATNPTINNATVGKVLTLTGVVPAGETVTLDARPGAKTVTNSAGIDLYPSLTKQQWWHLAVGPNRVRLEANGTTAASALSVRWRRCWLTV